MTTPSPPQGHTPERHVITFSRYIAQLSGVEQLLGASRLIKRCCARAGYRGAGEAWVVGWGLKPDALKAQHFAARNGLPYLTLEDGFLRSVDLGVKRSPTYSIVADDVGAHYDATRPSRLENLLNGVPLAPLPGDPPALDAAALLEDAAFLQRARANIDAIVAARLSKYNVSPEVDLPAADRPRVLVVDQTAGDFAIRYGLASADSFRQMLAAARAENPEAEILIKTHPDVLTGQKRAHFGPGDVDQRTRLLTDDINPIHLLQQVDKVYVVTSQLGFEALMAGRPVSCFGAPFYAGWGLTDDRCPITRRQHQRSLEQVFAAAYMLYARYIDPDLGTPCELERVIEHLALQRHWFHHNRGDWYCHGFGWRQRQTVRDYLMSPWNRIRFIRRPVDIPADGAAQQTRVLVNAHKPAGPVRTLAAQRSYPLWRMAKSFLVTPPPATWLTPPPSMIIAPYPTGNPSASTDSLVMRLSQARFSADELKRARALRGQWLATCKLLDAGKAAHQRLSIHVNPEQKVILVVGTGPRDNRLAKASDARLLAAVRQVHPAACILYSPYAAQTGMGQWLRRKGSGYDQLISADDIGEALQWVDEVHTVGSSIGFDALLRGCKVVTYGRPFYAGWGLTKDRDQQLQRDRTLSLDALVCAALLEYPRYLNDTTGQFTSAEMAIARLARASRAGKTAWPLRILPPRYWRRAEAYIIGISRRILSTISHYAGRT